MQLISKQGSSNNRCESYQIINCTNSDTTFKHQDPIQHLSLDIIWAAWVVQFVGDGLWHLIASRETYLARVIERERKRERKTQQKQEAMRVFICDLVPMPALMITR